MSPKRPNILFFFTDQQRADTCGCYGQKLPTTPELDRMAEAGVRFEHAFTPQPVCGPTRAILQTGLYATEVGCYRNGIALPLDQDTMAKRLNGAGYKTAYIGKWHLASNDTPSEPGGEVVNHRTVPVPPEWRGGYRDHWLASDVLEFTSHGYDGHMFDSEGKRRDFPEGRYRVDAQTDWVLEYLDAQDGEDPFFLFTSYIEPHHQNDNNRYEGPHGSKERWSNYEAPGDLAGQGGDWEENYPDYLGCIHSLDGALGRVRKKLEQKGMLENTIIVFTSDHGSHFRTRNLEYKRSCHEASLRVPLVISGLGFEGGKVVKDLVSLIDLPATLLKAAGAQPIGGMQGGDLKSLARGDSPDWRNHHFFQISESGNGRGIRIQRWKYCVESPEEQAHLPHASTYHEAYLYDLEADPNELENLVDREDLQGLREELKQKLLVAMARANEPPVEIFPCL